MKTENIFLLVIVAFLLSFCKHRDGQMQQVSDSTIAVEQHADTMSVADTADVDNPGSDIKNDERYSWKSEDIVSGNAFYRLRYCGGARPTPEIEKEFSKEYPLVLQKIKLVNAADDSDFVITMTDADGHFSAGLHAGVYNYYIVPTSGSKVPPNPDCPGYFEKSYGSISVVAGGMTGLKLLYAFPCDPCSPPKP